MMKKFFLCIKILFLASICASVAYIIPQIEFNESFLFKSNDIPYDYSSCIEMQSSKLIKDMYPEIKIILPAIVTFKKIQDLQKYDLCMRRFKNKTNFTTFKSFFLKVQYMNLSKKYLTHYELKNSDDIATLKRKLFIFYPDYYEILKNYKIKDTSFSPYDLDIMSLLYLCIVKKQINKQNEEECFVYEGRKELASKIFD